MMCHQQESTYFVRVDDVIDADRKKLVDKLKQIKAGEARSQEKGNHINIGKNTKIKMF